MLPIIRQMEPRETTASVWAARAPIAPERCMALHAAKSGTTNLTPMVFSPVCHMRHRATGLVSYQNQKQKQNPPPPLHPHAPSDRGAGDLVAVWGPDGHRDTANRPEKGGPGVDRDAPLGPDPFGFAAYQDVTSSPPPLCPHWVPEWGTTGERVGVSPAGFCLPFSPPGWEPIYTCLRLAARRCASFRMENNGPLLTVQPLHSHK